MFNTRFSSVCLLLLLLLISLFFSFYKLENLYHIGYDQERDYQEVQQMVLTRRPVLIGPRVVSEAGFHLGPWHYYFLVPFYLAFRADPIFQAYVAGMVNVAIVAWLFYFIRKHISSLAGFLAGVIWVSELHRVSWNVMYYPMAVIAIVEVVISRGYRLKSLLFLAFLVGMGINFHVQFIFFLPVLAIFIIKYFRIKKSKRIVGLLSVIGAFLVPFAPLIIFDIRHNFINIATVFNFAGQSVSLSSGYIDRFVFAVIQFSREFRSFLPLAEPYELFVSLFLLVALFYLNSRNLKILMLLLVVPLSIVAFSFYGGSHWPEYYLASAVLVLFLILTLTIGKNAFGIVALFIVAIFSMIRTLNLLVTYDDTLGYNHQRDAVLYILEKAKPYNRPNITYDFPVGEGNGFGIIRTYYEKPIGPQNPSMFFVGYSDNPRHNGTEMLFGRYAVSENWRP